MGSRPSRCRQSSCLTLNLMCMLRQWSQRHARLQHRRNRCSTKHGHSSSLWTQRPRARSCRKTSLILLDVQLISCSGPTHPRDARRGSSCKSASFELHWSPCFTSTVQARPRCALTSEACHMHSRIELLLGTLCWVVLAVIHATRFAERPDSPCCCFSTC